MTKLNQEEQKILVGTKVADHPLINNNTENPLVIGVGTGSTVLPFIEALGKRVNGNEKLKIIAVVTSEDSKTKCKARGIKVKSVDSVKKIHIAVDGADEVDPDFNLIKGGGGAHVIEKLVDYKAEYFVVIVDESKDVKCLGKFKLPVEIKRIKGKGKQEEDNYYNRIKSALKNNGAGSVEFRMDKKDNTKRFVTDNENYIFDVQFMYITNPKHLEEVILRIGGVVENGVGIFTSDHVNEVWIGKADGDVKKLEKK